MQELFMTTASAPRAIQAALHVEILDGIGVLTLDLPGESVNTLSVALAEEFYQALAQLERDEGARGAVLISGKPDSFIAGADVEQLLAARTAADAEAMSREGQEFLNRLERLRLPVVAAIHGVCLGGGLEVALACTYRIATEHPKTLLALPEVQLGLIPGAGGTQRLPRLVGLQEALTMILEGRNVRGKRALKIGLIDELVHPAILRDVALRRARELADSPRKRRIGPGKRGPASVLLEANPIGRSIVFRKARQVALKKTRGHYPAPLAAIDVVQAGYERGFEAGLREEAHRFGGLTQSPVAKELMFLFFATTALRKDPGVEEPAPEPQPVHKLGVLGAGFMGAGITSVAVQQLTPVRMKDTDPARIGAGLAAVRDVLKERLDKRQITPLEFEDMMILAGGSTDYTGFGNADVVIEAVFEDLALKQRVLREVEPLIPEHAVYASNTSTIPIARIAEAAERPERVLGMHFFSPVHKMPLLEIVVTPKTDRETTVTAVAYGKRLGKTVIVVNDGPGFYTTRTLSAYMNEAGRLLDEGARIDAVDDALVGFGFPVGPITLLDEVGLDVGGRVGQVLAEAFGPRMAPPESLRRVVESGRTGRKGRKGFYLYDAAGAKGDVDPSVYELVGPPGAQRAASAPRSEERRNIPDDEIVQRCVLAMVNEAARCLEEGILRGARDGDIGAVFGIGFPPFRGGPFRYVDAVGADTIVRELDALYGRFAPRFEPAEVLVAMARARRRFYPAEERTVR
jgi:3-hydroxyacyl-CoA dehydrogenase / enoyl-CoA hydratase / 3-hydroxybutyryl-CoA epimerase